MASKILGNHRIRPELHQNFLTFSYQSQFIGIMVIFIIVAVNSWIIKSNFFPISLYAFTRVWWSQFCYYFITIVGWCYAANRTFGHHVHCRSTIHCLPGLYRNVGGYWGLFGLLFYSYGQIDNKLRGPRPISEQAAHHNFTQNRYDAIALNIVSLSLHKLANVSATLLP